VIAEKFLTGIMRFPVVKLFGLVYLFAPLMMAPDKSACFHPAQLPQRRAD
jgi:hypothetical protein